MSNKDILRRIDILEQKMNPPQTQEIRFFHNGTAAEVEAFRLDHPGAKIINFLTICGRKCPDDCQDRAAKSCRFNCPGTQEHRQVNQ